MPLNFKQSRLEGSLASSSIASLRHEICTEQTYKPGEFTILVLSSQRGTRTGSPPSRKPSCAKEFKKMGPRNKTSLNITHPLQSHFRLAFQGHAQGSAAESSSKSTTLGGTPGLTELQVLRLRAEAHFHFGRLLHRQRRRGGRQAL